MKTNRVALLLSVCALAFMSAAQASPLEDLRNANVSRLEFGSFKLEVALTAVHDWPFAVEGTSVSARLNPDRIDIVVAVHKVDPASFRAACTGTLGRLREFLYVDANGTARMGRSWLAAYFDGPWRGGGREPALRALDRITLIRANVVGRGTCQAPLVGGPITF
jgi:hypothetical protein